MDINIAPLLKQPLGTKVDLEVAESPIDPRGDNAGLLDASIVVALVLREASTEWISETLAAHPRDGLRMSWVNLAKASIAIAKEEPAADVGLEAAMAHLGVGRRGAGHASRRRAQRGRRR